MRILLTMITLLSICFADVYYIAPADSGGSNANPGTYAEPWHSLNYALNKYANDMTNARVGPGDTLYFRGGVYDITSMSKPVGRDCPYIFINSSAITEPLLLKSYPGEWAIFDGGNGDDDNSGTSMLGSNNTNYNIVFDNFEIRNCLTTGINEVESGNSPAFWVGCTFKNLYIHDCKNTNVNANPAGLRLAMQNCIIEHCTFEDNGTTGSGHHNNANLILYMAYVDYPEGEANIRSNNIIRYNVFDGAGSGIKDKGSYNLVDDDAPAKTDSSDCNEFYYNIIKNARGDAYYTAQDFLNFHHNLIIDCNDGLYLRGSADTDKTVWWNEIYANTFFNNSGQPIDIHSDDRGNTNNAYGHIFHSNIFKDNGESTFFIGDVTVFEVTSDYNFWDTGDDIGRRCLDETQSLSNWQTNYSYDINSDQGAITFINSSNNDYRLETGSIGEDSALDGGDAGAFDESNWYSLAGYGEDDDTAPTTNETFTQSNDSTRIQFSGTSADIDTLKVWLALTQNPSSSNDNLIIEQYDNTAIDTTVETVQSGWVYIDWYMVDDSSNVAEWSDSLHHIYKAVSSIPEIDSIYLETTE